MSILKDKDMANTYGTNTGDRYTTSQIDIKVRKAKMQKISIMIDEYGYVFCEECKVNSSNTYIDCSHTISVKKAKETSKAQLCYDVNNIRMLCRKCHNKHDNTY